MLVLLAGCCTCERAAQQHRGLFAQADSGAVCSAGTVARFHCPGEDMLILTSQLFSLSLSLWI